MAAACKSGQTNRPRGEGSRRNGGCEVSMWLSQAWVPLRNTVSVEQGTTEPGWKGFLWSNP